MGVALNGVADWLGELAFRKRIRSYKVLNPMALLGDTDEDDLFKVAKHIAKFWGSDPVHMKAEGYKQLAQALAGQLVDLAFSRTNSQTQTSTTAGTLSCRPQRGRPSNVAADYAIVHRYDSPGPCFNQNAGNYRGRGLGGGGGRRNWPEFNNGRGGCGGRYQGSGGGRGGRFHAGRGSKRFLGGQKYRPY
jgi:hypothetical protein